MNQKLSLNSQAESSADDSLVPSDDAVRQALLRMGAGQGGNQGGTHGHQGASSRRGGEQIAAASASPDARRRRFSQNEHVPVEYVSRDRSNGRHDALRHDQGRHDQGRHDQGRHDQGRDPGRLDLTEPAEDRLGPLERELERERQARVAAERSLSETRLALQHAQTRLAHLEIDLNEARAQRQALLALAPSSAAASPRAAPQGRTQGDSPPAQEPALGLGRADPAEPEGAAAQKRGRGRPRLNPPRAAAEEPEPEPVKWWIGD